MATYQIKVEYGEKCFCSFLIRNINNEKLFDEIKRNCSQLVHLPNSRIRVRYRDDDGDMVKLIPNDEFSFNEILRSARDIKDREYKKIYLLANEIDSPMLRKIRRLDLEAACDTPAIVQTKSCLQPKHLSFNSPQTDSKPTIQQQQVNSASASSTSSSTKSNGSPLDAQNKSSKKIYNY